VETLIEQQSLVLYPLRMSLLHMLCMSQKFKSIQEMIRDEKFIPCYQMFMADSRNKTPFHYLLEHPKKDNITFNLLLEVLCSWLESKSCSRTEFLLILEALSDIMVNILGMATSKNAKEFLDITFHERPKQHDLPQFGSIKKSVTLSTSSNITKREVDSLINDGSEAITFKVSPLKIDYSLTSSTLKDLANTLVDLDDTEVLNTLFITSLIKYLFQKSFPISFALFGGFAILIALMSIYLSLGERNLGLEIAILAMSFIYLSIEIYQMIRLTLIEYWKSVWSFVDTGFLCLLIAFVGVRIGDLDYELSMNWVGTIVILTGYLRLTWYLRIFKSTRDLIFIIIQIIKDMRGFIIILMLIIFGFSIIFNIFDRDILYKDHLNYTYGVLYGLPDGEELSDSQIVIVSVISFLLNVVLLNMLISIMGDSYGKVQEAKSKVNALIQLDLSLEAMSIAQLFSKPKSTTDSMIFCYYSKNIEDGHDGSEQADGLMSLRREVVRLKLFFSQQIAKCQTETTNEILSLKEELLKQKRPSLTLSKM